MAKLPEYFCFKVKPDPKKLVFEIERVEAEDRAVWAWNRRLGRCGIIER